MTMQCSTQNYAAIGQVSQQRYWIIVVAEARRTWVDKYIVVVACRLLSPVICRLWILSQDAKSVMKPGCAK
jgi:hypothetical protein